MFLPALTETEFLKARSANLTELGGISALNSRNVKGNFTPTPPASLRGQSFAVLKNAANRFKYMPVTVDESGHITSFPEFPYTSYLFHNDQWYKMEIKDYIFGSLRQENMIDVGDLEA